MKLGLLASSAFALLAPSALADPQIGAAETIVLVPALSRDLELADLDGDGELDLLVGVYEVRSRVVYGNLG